MSQGINSYHVFWIAFDWLIKTRIRAFDWLIKTEIRDLHVRNSRTSTMASKYCSNFCSKLLLP